MTMMKIKRIIKSLVLVYLIACITVLTACGGKDAGQIEGTESREAESNKESSAGTGEENGEIVYSADGAEEIAESENEIDPVALWAYDKLVGYWTDGAIVYYFNSFIADGQETFFYTRSDHTDKWYRCSLLEYSDEENDYSQDRFWNYMFEAQMQDDSGNMQNTDIYILYDDYTYERYMYIKTSAGLISLNQIPTYDLSMIPFIYTDLQFTGLSIDEKGEPVLSTVSIDHADYWAMQSMILDEEGYASDEGNCWLFNTDFQGYHLFKRKEGRSAYLYDGYYADCDMANRLASYNEVRQVDNIWTYSMIDNPYMDMEKVELSYDVLSGYVINDKYGNAYLYEAKSDTERLYKYSFTDGTMEITIDDVIFQTDIIGREDYENAVYTDSIVPKYMEDDLEVYKESSTAKLYFMYNDIYFEIADNSAVTPDILRMIASSFTAAGGEPTLESYLRSIGYDGRPFSDQAQLTRVEQDSMRTGWSSNNGLSAIYGKINDRTFECHYFGSFENATSFEYDLDENGKPIVLTLVESDYDFPYGDDLEVICFIDAYSHTYEQLYAHNMFEPYTYVRIVDLDSSLEELRHLYGVLFGYEEE